MKELIVAVGLTILGVIILNMIIGPGEGSLKENTKEAMQKSVERYMEQPE